MKIQLITTDQFSFDLVESAHDEIIVTCVILPLNRIGSEKIDMLISRAVINAVPISYPPASFSI